MLLSKKAEEIFIPTPRGPHNFKINSAFMDAQGAKTLKPRCVLVAITFLALMSVTSAFAAPREIEEFCFEQAQRATLPYRRGAWEAFMANCIADLTPTPTKGRKYRKY